MDIQEVAPYLGTWADKLAPFVISPEFDEIFNFLKKEGLAHKKICPEAKNVFRAFKETPYNKLKAVFLLQDPYHQIRKINGKDVLVADGIPMSCSNTGILQPSLELFYDGMEENLGKKVGRNADLTYLCNQGILLLNTSLTVELHKAGSHQGVWTKFMAYLIGDILNYYTSGLCVVAFGKHAQGTARNMMPFIHNYFDIEHPAAASYKNRKWIHENVFTQINVVLKQNMNEEIYWDYNDYKRYLESLPSKSVVNEHITQA